MSPPDDPLFDPASTDWVMVDGAGFVFEPWGAEFTPPEPGRVLVTFGHDKTRHRGVEVTQVANGWVSIWVPAASQVYWLSDVARDSAPWEAHLLELDHERGTLR